MRIPWFAETITNFTWRHGMLASIFDVKLQWNPLSNHSWYRMVLIYEQDGEIRTFAGEWHANIETRFWVSILMAWFIYRVYMQVPALPSQCGVRAYPVPEYSLLTIPIDKECWDALVASAKERRERIEAGYDAR